MRHLRVIRNLRIVEAHGTRSDDGCGDRRVLEAREASNVGVGEGGTGGIRRRLPVFLLSAYAKFREFSGRLRRRRSGWPAHVPLDEVEHLADN